MAYTHSQNAPIRNFVAEALDGIWNFFVLIGESNFRVKEAERLQNLTDDQLAARGLKREDIPAYVFRDLGHI